MIVHTVDWVVAVGANTATGAWQPVGTYQISPANTSTHPWLAAIALNFERYKLKFLRLHYQHFIGTSQQGQLVLQYVPNPDFNSGTFVGITQAQSQNMSNYMSGALYEDFFHTCDLHGLDPDQWYNCSLTQPGSDSPSSNIAGMAMVATANTGGDIGNTGNMWIEAVYEFSGRKLNTVTVGLSKANIIIHSKLERDQKLALLSRLSTQLLDAYEEAEAAKVREKVDELTAIMKELKLQAAEVPSSQLKAVRAR